MVWALAAELRRLDGHYGRLLEEADRDLAPADEEVRAHALHAVVHPLVLHEWALLVERAEWTLRSESSAGAVAATRPLVGDGAWSLRCPGGRKG